MTKAILRKKHLMTRSQMDFKDVHILSEHITSRLLALESIKFSRHILGYMSFKNEVSLASIQAYCDKAYISYYVPRVMNKEVIQFYKVTNLDDLELSAYGILEPKVTCEKLDAQEEAVMIVPGICFDQKGNRIGYGGGYYDRYMKANASYETIGVAFSHQLEESLPYETHDQRLDMLVTEHNTQKFNQ